MDRPVHPKLRGRFRADLARGRVIGLFPGSFDPPHAGHLLLAENIRKLYQLDLVWWLISPRNPHKLPPQFSGSQRMALCHELIATHPSVNPRFQLVTNLEACLGTVSTIAFVKQLLRYDSRKFCLLLGSDSFLDLPNWNRGMELANLLPIVVYPRPDSYLRINFSKAALKYRRRFLHQHRFAKRIRGNKYCYDSENIMPTTKITPGWSWQDAPKTITASSKLKLEQGGRTNSSAGST